MGNIAVDGDLSDWAALPPCPGGSNTQDYQMWNRGNLSASLNYAWDADNLYLLIQETAPDDNPTEATYNTPAGETPWEETPYFYDSIAIFRRFPVGGVGDADAPRQDFWFGLTGLEEPPSTQRMLGRLNEGDPFDLYTSSVHGVLPGDLRYVEASMPMSEVLPGPPEVGTTFYASPLYMDGPWGDDPTQEMIGGGIHPGAQDLADQTFVKLCPEPTALVLLGIGGVFLRRRRV